MFHKFYKDIDELHEAVKLIRHMSQTARANDLRDALNIVSEEIISVFAPVLKDIGSIAVALSQMFGNTERE